MTMAPLVPARITPMSNDSPRLQFMVSLHTRAMTPVETKRRSGENEGAIEGFLRHP